MKKRIFIVGLLLLIVISGIMARSSSPARAQNDINQFSLEPGTFIPGQFIIGFKDGMSPQDLEAQIAARRLQNESIRGRLQVLRENIQYALSGKDTPEDSLAALQEVNTAVGFAEAKPLQTLENTDTYVYMVSGTTSPREVLRQYNDLSTVAFVEPDGKAEAFAQPNDADYGQLWAMPKIKAEDAWEISTGSSSVTVGVVDTGVQVNHPDLQGNAQKSDAVSPACTVNGDKGAHGSHVAGTIGAVGNNSTGVAGVNWTVHINGYGVLCSRCDDGRMGCGSFSDIIAGVNKAVADNVDVINMSLGGTQHSTAMQQAVRNARNSGILVVVAAGNSNADTMNFYPARYPEVMTVSSTGPNDQKASYSNFGNAVDIAGPGGNGPQGGCTASLCIHSTIPPSGYANYQGTSMASPHVAGAAALLLSVNPNLTPDQLQNALQCTADDLGTPGWDTIFGHGRLNLKAAIDAVKGGNIPTCQSPAEPTNNPQPTGVQPTQDPNITVGAPTPTGTQHPCPDEAAKGNYNCDSAIDNNDYKSWEADFKSGVSSLAPWFEYIRKIIYNRS